MKILFLLLSLFLMTPMLHAQTITYSGTNVGVGSTAPGATVDVQGTVKAISFSGYYPYVKVSEREVSGSTGGQAVANTWTNRVLNTIDNDTQSIASLSSNQVTLPAGTYLVKVTSPFTNNLSGVQLRLQNITSSSTLLLGTSGYIIAGSGFFEYYIAPLSGLITLSTTSTIAVQYDVNGSVNVNDLGVGPAFGTEVFTVAEFTKIQ